MHGAFWDGGTAVAQSWPANPIRFIVPFPPGGTTDQIARRVQPLLQADLKTTIVIENRAGAGGAIGTQAAVTSPPDGTTFLLVFDTHAVNPSVLPNLQFDTVKDLAPIMLIGTSPMVITSHPMSEYRSFADVIAAARKKDGLINYGTVGAGSLAQLLAPARTSNDIIARMHDAMTKALEEPAVRRSLSEQEVVYRLSSPAAFGQFIEAEVARWAKVVKDNKIVAAD
jgi:tripartite-type tricarboxylate transporter receptor subunit TctC